MKSYGVKSYLVAIGIFCGFFLFALALGGGSSALTEKTSEIGLDMPNIAYEPPDTVALRSHFEWLRSFDLEETPEVVNVNVAVVVDGDGLLIADRSENQVRRYWNNGTLDWVRGGSGETPIGVSRVRSITRLGSDLLAVGSESRVVTWSDSTTDVNSIKIDLLEVERIVGWNGTSFVASSRYSNADPGATLIHVMSYPAGDVRTGLLRPQFPEEMRQTASVVGWGGFDTMGDDLVAFFSMTDTLWVYSDQLRRVEALPLHAATFRHPTQIPTEGGRPARNKWAGTVSLITDVYWVEDWGFLIQFMSFVENLASYSLMALTPDGRPRFEISRSPRILAVDGPVREVYFQSPRSPSPSSILVGRLQW